VLPAANTLLATGAVTWPDGTTLDLTGIDLVMHDAVRCAHDLPPTRRRGFTARAVRHQRRAWLDRPGDRYKDLGDLGLLLDRYLESDDTRCFDDPALDKQREFDNVRRSRSAATCGPCARRGITPGSAAAAARLVRQVPSRSQGWPLAD